MEKFSLKNIPVFIRVLSLLGIIFLAFVILVIFLIVKASHSGDSYSGGLAPEGSLCDYGYNYNTKACCDEDDYSCEFRDRHGASTSTPDSCLQDGITAQCHDGSCSFSANREGACAHHGGVEVWY